LLCGTSEKVFSSEAKARLIAGFDAPLFLRFADSQNPYILENLQEPTPYIFAARCGIQLFNVQLKVCSPNLLYCIPIACLIAATTTSLPISVAKSSVHSPADFKCSMTFGVSFHRQY
jgi:hypothetical protein